MCTGRTGPEGGTYFLSSKLIVWCATLRSATPRWQGFRTCLTAMALPPSVPRIPRTGSSGCPAGFSFLILMASLFLGLIDQIINAIEFIADEEDVDVADETLGWE
jgi:hypothetical protein